MIANVIGASGSGKSTIMRGLMDKYDNVEPFHVEGRKRPLYYRLSHPGVKDLYVIGHYEIPCGGCDTISKQQFEKVYSMVREFHAKGDCNVAYEGLLLTVEVRRRLELMEEVGKENLATICLNTPMEQCIHGVRERRAARTGIAIEDQPTEKDSFMKNMKSKYKSTETTRRRILEAGGQVYDCNREEGLAQMLKLLGWS